MLWAGKVPLANPGWHLPFRLRVLDVFYIIFYFVNWFGVIRNLFYILRFNIRLWCNILRTLLTLFINMCMFHYVDFTVKKNLRGFSRGEGIEMYFSSLCPFPKKIVPIQYDRKQCAGTCLYCSKSPSPSRKGKFQRCKQQVSHECCLVWLPWCLWLFSELALTLVRQPLPRRESHLSGGSRRHE